MANRRTIGVVRSRRYALAKVGRVPNSHARWDKYLLRGSHVAQIALVAVSAWALVYTVVPLYEKALLDEAIARREIELAALKSESAKLYDANRQYALANFKRALMYECGRGKLLMSTDFGTFPDEVFNLDVADCLLSNFEQDESLTQLRPQDSGSLAAEVTRVAVRLQALRAKWRATYAAAPARYAEQYESDPDSLTQAGPKERELAAILKSMGVTEAHLAEEHRKMRIAAAVREVANEYIQTAEAMMMSIGGSNSQGSSSFASQPSG